MSGLFESDAAELEALRAAVLAHGQELAAISGWQQRMRARTEKAEATVARVSDLADRLIIEDRSPELRDVGEELEEIIGGGNA